MKKLRTASFRQLVFVAFLLASTISFAQPATKPDKKPHAKLEQKSNLKELNLTEDQKAQVKAINKEFKTQMKALKEDSTQTVNQQREKKIALSKAYQLKLDNVFTTEQKAKRQQLNVTTKQRHSEISADHFGKMQKELSLTDAQISELRNNQAALKARMDAIQNNTSLDATAKRQQLAALKTERKAIMEKVLTTEQQQKFRGMHKEHKGGKKMHKGKRTKVAKV